jgi:hypothetical protein
MCNVENNINNQWGPAYTVFSQNSGAWIDAFSIMNANSACWIDTYNNVSTLSGFWLKPITLVYPYPFSGSTNISTVQTWLNENFPIKSGNCYNFIVGQELYIQSPEYTSINRVVQGNQQAGNQFAFFTYTCDCIGRGSYTGNASTVVNCGGVTINLTVPDQFINKFVGLKFTVGPDFQWDSGVKIFG